jgi:rRNA maturation RNase YbeY
MKSAGSTQAAAIELTDATGRLAPADVAWIREHLARAMAWLKLSGEVSARVIGDAEMSAAHEEFAGVPGTTDVLTFDLVDDQGARTGVLEADILVCLDEAERQGAQAPGRREHAARAELLLYLVHGVLHCAGHDDLTEADAQRMHAREDEVLTAIGVGPVFRRAGTGEGGA